MFVNEALPVSLVTLAVASVKLPRDRAFRTILSLAFSNCWITLGLAFEIAERPYTTVSTAPSFAPSFSVTALLCAASRVIVSAAAVPVTVPLAPLARVNAMLSPESAPANSFVRLPLTPLSVVTAPLILIFASTLLRSSLRLVPNVVAPLRVIVPVVFAYSVSAPLAIALFSTLLKLRSPLLLLSPRYTSTVDVTPVSTVTLPPDAVIKASTLSI